MKRSDTDDLLRSAASKNAAAAAGSEGLIHKSEGDLYAFLAAMVIDPGAAAGSPTNRFQPLVDADDLYRSDAATALGKRIFSRWSRAVHDFVCAPDAEDHELKERMLQAIFSKGGGGVAIVAGGLVAAFGLSPAIAAVVAALLIKLIVAPAVDEVCKVWGARIAGTAMP